MSLKSFTNKIKLGMAAILVFSSTACPVFAASEHNYPAQESGMPVITISKIDLTNNKLEFLVNGQGLRGKKLKHLGAGWNLNATDNTDLLSYDSVSNSWSQRVFWNDTEDLSNYLTEVYRYWLRYTVDAEVDLKNNTSRKLFYIAEFEDGEKWISRVSYSECADSWVEGMSCDVKDYIRGLNYDNVYYGLVLAQGATVKEETESVPEQTQESTQEPVRESMQESVQEGPTQEPVEESADLVDDNPVQESISELAQESTSDSETEEVPEQEENDEFVTAKTIKNITIVDGDIEEIEEEIDEEEIDEELDLSPEGYGETTLEVPNLGKTEVDYFNWLPYFIGGTISGGGLTWFLVYINNRRKLSFLR